MARFCDVVGYGESCETVAGSGVWSDVIAEVTYYGDVLRNTSQSRDSDHLNPNLVVNNSISIVADQYAIEHFSSIRYVRWAGTLWTVTNVEVKSPRLTLSLGSVYNGPTPRSSG